MGQYQNRPVPCLWWLLEQMAQVKAAYWDSYVANINNYKTVSPHMYGLSDSLKAAVRETTRLAPPNTPWFASARSLGGAYISLGVS